MRLIFCSFFLAASLILAKPDDPAAMFLKAQQTMDKTGDLDTDKAISLLKHAVDAWQGALSNDPEYAKALDYLAVVLMAQIRNRAIAQEEGLSDFADWAKKAAQYTKRALAICESNPATKPEDLAFALELQAQVEGPQGSGAALWDRAAQIRGKRVAQLNAADATFGPGGSLRNETLVPVESTTPPVAVLRGEPDYTAVARIAFYRGKVTFRATIRTDGRVHNLELARGLGFGLDEQAALAVRQWTYQPAKKDGKAVSVAAQLEVNFEIK